MNIYIYIYNLTIQKKKKRKLLATNWYSRPILIRFGQNIFSLLLLYIWKENVDNSSQTCIYRLNIVKNKVMLFLGHAFFGYSFNTILWGGGGGDTKQHILYKCKLKRHLQWCHTKSSWMTQKYMDEMTCAKNSTPLIHLTRFLGRKNSFSHFLVLTRLTG